jgi:hypothetical protein
MRDSVLKIGFLAVGVCALITMVSLVALAERDSTMAAIVLVIGGLQTLLGAKATWDGASAVQKADAKRCKSSAILAFLVALASLHNGLQLLPGIGFVVIGAMLWKEAERLAALHALRTRRPDRPSRTA